MGAKGATRKVVIIGSGPAGFTAGIYTARANLEPLLFEGLPKDILIPGGQLMLTTDVENYPGFPEGIQGPEMMQLFRKQAERFGTEIVGDEVVEVDFSERPFLVRGTGREVRTQAVIVATGAAANWLGLESEARLRGAGVSACATCDGFFFRDKDLTVVGGGDTAMEEATFLTKFASRVTIVHRRDKLRASTIMAERARQNPKIDFLLDTVVSEVLDVAKGRVTGVRLRNVKSGEESVRPTDGLFLAIGHTPITGIFAGKLDRDEKGYLRVHEGTRTSVEGVFAAGDVADAVYRQAITAAGSGCMAAIDCERWLEGQA